MVDVEDQAGFVGQFLQFRLPQPDARAVGAAAVGGDGQFAGLGIALSTHAVEPASDQLDGEFGRIGGNPKLTKPAFAVTS